MKLHMKLHFWFSLLIILLASTSFAQMSKGTSKNLLMAAGRPVGAAAEPVLPQYASTIVWYRMNAPAKTNNSSAISSNPMLTSGSPLWVTNSEGYYLNGSSYGYFDFGKANGATQLSWSIWVKMSNRVDWAGILVHRGVKFYATSLYDVTSRIQSRFNNSGTAETTIALTNGIWTHFALTWRSGESAISYVNGVSNASGSAVSNVMSIDAWCRIGVDDYNSARKWVGNVDDVCVWTNKLTAAEVLQVYKFGH
jgi:hypothetical protein